MTAVAFSGSSEPSRYVKALMHFFILVVDLASLNPRVYRDTCRLNVAHAVRCHGECRPVLVPECETLDSAWSRAALRGWLGKPSKDSIVKPPAPALRDLYLRGQPWLDILAHLPHLFKASHFLFT
jgi:hypothetical protein